MKPQILKLFERCISNGVSLGYSRAVKYTDEPTETAITTEITKAIEYELHEWFNFLDGQNGQLLDLVMQANSSLENGDSINRAITMDDVEEMVRLVAGIVRLQRGDDICGDGEL